jgi:uncharacterized protein (TIGR03435 family)
MQFAAAVGLALLVTASSQFDVASVKGGKPGPRGVSAQRITPEPGGKRFSASGASLRSLIVFACDVTDGQVLGGPAWASSELFDIEAKTDHAVSRNETRLMLQELLADRFQLKFHRETRDLAVAALASGKNIRMLPAAQPETDPDISVHAGKAQALSLTGQNVDMPLLARYLSGRLHRLVVDQTGFAGGFDFTAEQTVDPIDASDQTVAERDLVSHLFADFVRVLGLRLENKTLPVELW